MEFVLEDQLKKEQSIIAAVPFEKKKAAADFLKTKFSFEYRQALLFFYGDGTNVCWFSRCHHSAGMHIRNLLRQNGYGEDYFGIENLDYIYVQLLEIMIGVYPKVEKEEELPKVRKIRV